MISNRNAICEKKSRASSPALKIVSTLFSRKLRFGVDWRVDAALLRVRVPPETWTTRPWPYGPSELDSPRLTSPACHQFRQRMFKQRADFEMIGDCSSGTGLVKRYSG